MNSFRIVLLVCLIGLAYAQFDWDRIRDVLDDDQYELFKRIQDSNRRARGGNPFENSPFGTPRGDKRNQRRERGHRDQKRNDSKPSSPDSPLSASDCVCRMKSSARIVGGETVIPHSIPWQVSLASYRQHFCGGSIVNKKFILTAAHCIDSKRANQIQVRVGLHKLNDANSANTYEVAKIHMHPYTSPSKPGDYALLELKQAIKFVPGQIEPGCINNVKQSYDGDLIASGWGTTSVSRKDTRTGQLHTGNLADQLKKAILHEDEEHCEDYLVCVNSDNKDSVCQGDSGGPLHYIRNGRATIEGVASFVTGTSQFGARTVEMCTGHGAYSANHYYKAWFEKIIGQNYCKL